ncbi:MAG TPA: DUF4157 domain-containing protein [Kofleriaceae bacterium]|nr:DUF4157 domain-containing protein [Kofleriaceae bacterium]
MREHRSAGGGHAASESQTGTPSGPGKRTLVETVQLSAAPGAALGDASAVAGTPPAGGSPLPDPVRAKMERSFGADFSTVSVHQDGRADAMGAQAYAQGEHVHMGAGRYDPSSQPGQALIGHELSHVVQQRQGRAAAGQGKGAAVVADAALEAEADRHGELAAQGLPISGAGAATAGAAAGGAVQLKGDPPAGQVAIAHTFTVPTITDLNTIPDPVNRNHVINQTYHQIDTAMTGYLGDPLVANWFTFGQHASREAGTQIRSLQEGLQVLRDIGPTLAGLSFGPNPIIAFESARSAIRIFRRVLDLMSQDGLIRQAIQLALAKAGISDADLRNLVNEAQSVLLESPTAAMNPIAMYHMLRFIGHVTTMVGKLIVAIPAVIRAVELVYENMKRGNKEIYENVAPAARNFLLAAQGASTGVPGRMAFAGDTNGFLSAAFAEYGEIRQLGDEARAAPGTPEAQTKLQQRHDKAMHANLLIGFQEQLIILQPIFNTMQQELQAMSGTMVLHDPNGAHPLANNWGDFYTRMGIDPARAPADPRTITPGSLPPLLPAAQRRGTISEYFNDNVDNEKVHEAPPPIAPG